MEKLICILLFAILCVLCAIHSELKGKRTRRPMGYQPKRPESKPLIYPPPSGGKKSKPN